MLSAYLRHKNHPQTVASRIRIYTNENLVFFKHFKIRRVGLSVFKQLVHAVINKITN